MHSTNFIRRLAILLAVCLLSGAAFAGERLTLNFNPDWRFIKDDPANASAPEFDDHAWTVVSAPHTYNDVDTFDDSSLAGHRGEQNQWGGRTWYRKTFTAPADWKGKKVFIEFEAARQFAEVYLNGKLLGISRNGFVPFGFDLSDNLKIGEKNVLAVMCDNRFMKDPVVADGPGAMKLQDLQAKFNAEIPEDVEKIRPDQIPWNNPHWHPAHGGLYRNVRLHVVDPLHISLPLYSFLKTVGPYVYASDISDASAKVNVEIPVENDRAEDAQVEVSIDVIDAAGKTVLSAKKGGNVQSGSPGQFDLSGAISNPKLWEPGYPYLYKVVCTLRADNQIVDTAEVPLGIRSVKWSVTDGFWINGRHVKLHGWGQKPTDEWPGLGAAQPDWMHYFTLDLMRQAGGNFVRWGHCAAGPAQINADDRLGLVTEMPGCDGESDTVKAAWRVRADAWRDLVIYFRNNPSILIWEGGNQKVNKEHAAELRGLVDKYDPHGGRAYAHRRADKVTAEFMTVGIGTEGKREIKDLPVIEGEYDREESPRRVWDNASPPNFGYPEAKGMTYQLTSEQFAAREVRHYVRKIAAEYHCGGANWIFSDSTSGGRVPAEVARASGEVDGVRLAKEAYYSCSVLFSNEPKVHIIGHWSYPAGTKKVVFVVSNAPDVELFVNGKSIGHDKPSDGFLFSFPNVQFEPGEIKAVAYMDGKSVATQTKQTAGPPAKLTITPITGPGGVRANGSDVALFDIEAVDAQGRRCPTFQQRVDFELEGPAIWRGGYNSGKPASTNNTYLDLECGINRVAVRSTLQPGSITLRAHSNGLAAASVSVESKPFAVKDGYSTEMPAVPTLALPAHRAAQMAQAFVPRIPPPKEGKFITGFFYSGPTDTVDLEQDAADGKAPFVDGDVTFKGLPPELLGADYVKAAQADKFYSAVDLMEIAIKEGSTVTIAYDEALPAPDWMKRQKLVASDKTVTIADRKMKLYTLKMARDGNVTLGSNSEDPKTPPCNMYVVFVNGGASAGGK